MELQKEEITAKLLLTTFITIKSKNNDQ